MRAGSDFTGLVSPSSQRSVAASPDSSVCGLLHLPHVRQMNKAFARTYNLTGASQHTHTHTHTHTLCLGVQGRAYSVLRFKAERPGAQSHRAEVESTSSDWKRLVRAQQPSGYHSRVLRPVEGPGGHAKRLGVARAHAHTHTHTLRGRDAERRVTQRPPQPGSPEAGARGSSEPGGRHARPQVRF